MNPRPGRGLSATEAVTLMGVVSVVMNRSNGAFTMDEHVVDNWQAQGRVGKTYAQAREDADRRKRKRDHRESGGTAGKRARHDDLRGEGDPYDDMG